MVTVVQLHPATAPPRAEPVAAGRTAADRDLVARALEFAEPLYAGNCSPEPT
jgi:hypothetical protein